MFGNRSKSSLGTLEWIAFFLTILGSLNWALIGAFDTDLVQMAFGSIGEMTRIIYVMIGIAALYVAWLAPQLAKR